MAIPTCFMAPKEALLVGSVIISRLSFPAYG
jgi:hypothetical protein